MGLFSRRGGQSSDPTGGGTGQPAGRADIHIMTPGEVEESTEAIARGGLPLTASERLGSERRTTSTSTLSPNEFLVLRTLGVEPLAQVMGSSVYQIGYQPLPYQMQAGMMMGAGIASSVLQVQTDAVNRCRELAISRLMEEAMAVGADAVVAVDISSTALSFGSNVVDTTISGTAIRYGEGRKPKSKLNQPALTNLSGAEVIQLLTNGFHPVGLLASSVFYFAPLMNVFGAGQMGGSIFAGGTWGGNFEVTSLSHAVRDSQRIVQRDISRKAKEMGAAGVVGAALTTTARPYGEERVQAVYYFSSIFATAIAEGGAGQTPSPPTMNLDLGV
ncbi:MAG: heavy metal-binding domain-containing protein [Acidimicrobiaceae bacterium]|nr:heavy metal-binding domain-containing protein [Acidimicrobiaceae bacterium]